jgi:hypothetical protein
MRTVKATDLSPGVEILLYVEGSALRGHAYTVGDLADGWWTLSNDRGDSFRIQYDEDEDCWYDEGACGFMLYLQKSS